ncbi:hypothetical protein EWM64_g404 [Hericium alpestre]|uniref:BHLH domain-containing protein n=1 Tax=Hericium alpestre TaxID=135208 RepID=A0A4Z0A984_9AGAM|nr:hypothetical protein EWM64_g404 [Hericium alpestre]
MVDNGRTTPLSPFAHNNQHPFPDNPSKSQRRGSITDPSLHAAGPHSLSRSSNPPAGPAFSPPDALHPIRDPPLKPAHPEPTSASLYVLGEAPSQPTDPSRKPPSPPSPPPTRSRSANHPSRARSPDVPPASSSPSVTNAAQGISPLLLSFLANANKRTPSDSEAKSSADQMNMDSKHVAPSQAPTHASSSQDPSRSNAASSTTQPPHGSNSSSLPHGTKRKFSHDRGMAAPSSEDVDPQLIGPGVPSTVFDVEGPAPKRRSSAVNTQHLAHIDAFDRRHSLDARMAHDTPPWWVGDRRESLLSNYSSAAFSADSPHARTPAATPTVAWQTQPPEQHPSPSQSEAEASGSNRPADPSSATPLAMMPSMTFNTDRRMSVSVPTNLPSAPSANSTTARAARSKSRPPSRGATRSRGGETPATEANAAEGNAEAADSGAGSSSSHGKELGSTPYSRSPELRVSHKLAERKRRKEMKDLFDELRDQLPADRGMKASKWEILSKAIDFIAQLKHGHQEMSREIDVLRHELDGIRQGMSFGPGGPHPVIYPSGPALVPGHYPPPGGHAIPPHQPPSHQPASISRPGSAQNVFPPGASASPLQNGTATVAPSATTTSKADAAAA